ncbi:homoserine dehydrogenase [Parasutterella secunda]|uniref:homoserine dehydrogenase n=1 Tax=Parasutterella secunda TaxID=626947 RepID=UPI0025A4B91B|nr:homoserine dehydrogenase [Parasutterella secunda]MDM8112695.1 homoserine dehydrogenase [Parasutterella secunda]MDM8218412.1 homoserine dehydrogenase [Parasutterella secunda]
MAEKLIVGMAGFGTVGSSVYQVLKRNAALIHARAGKQIEIKRVVCRKTDKVILQTQGNVIASNDLNSIIDDPSISVVIEVMGGIEPAKTFILNALKNGKDVITANKALLATHGDEIFTEARKQNRSVFFEASVAGGIPVIKALREGLAGNQISEISGILNGTCNYILSAMHKTPLSFAEALKNAQQLGYAEADPTFDIEGLDTGHKLSILTSLAFGVPFHFDITAVEGIKGISSLDIQFAQKLGFVVKLLATVEKINDRLAYQVAPTLIPQNSILAQVSDAMNAVEIVGDAVGKTLFYGAGAGGEATASAVLADVIDIAKGHKSIVKPDSATVVTFLDNNEKRNKNYIRFNSSSLNDLTNHVLPTLEKHQIVVEKIEEINENLVLLTQEIDEKTLQKALTELSQTYCNQLSFTRFRLAKSVN